MPGTLWTMELEAELAGDRQATEEALEQMEELVVRTSGVQAAHATTHVGSSTISMEVDLLGTTAGDAAERAAALLACGARYAGLGTPAVRLVSVAPGAAA